MADVYLGVCAKECLVMRKRLRLAAMKIVTPRTTTAAFFSILFAIPALAADSRTILASGTITVSSDSGKRVFLNDGPAKASASAARSSSNGAVVVPSQPKAFAAPTQRLMYWSNTEHRYKPVPHATPMAIEAARSAAAEVGQSAQTSQVGGLVRGGQSTPLEVDAAIEQAARRHNVDANLVRALIRVESNFNPHAVSRKGAIGLMQLMPSTAKQLNVTNPYDPAQNVDAGVRHLKKLLQDFGGNVKLSLAAYNAGEGAVHRSAGIPNFAETKNYVKRISALYASGNMVPLSGLSAPRYEALHYEPVRVSRNSQGVLTFTNTD